MKENPTPWDKEAIYDAEIHPLVAKIIEICQREELPFLVSVAYRNNPDPEDEDHSYCTSYGPGPGPVADPRLFEALKVIRRNRSMLAAAFTVTETGVAK